VTDIPDLIFQSYQSVWNVSINFKLSALSFPRNENFTHSSLGYVTVMVFC